MMVGEITCESRESHPPLNTMPQGLRNAPVEGSELFLSPEQSHFTPIQNDRRLAIGQTSLFLVRLSSNVVGSRSGAVSSELGEFSAKTIQITTESLVTDSRINKAVKLNIHMISSDNFLLFLFCCLYLRYPARKSQR